MAPRTLLALLLCLSGSLGGKVVGVHDGDTITVLICERSTKVRLYGIDSPEIGQAFSKAAKDFLSALCFGKNVTVIGHGNDRYGRLIGEVLLQDGTNVGQEMLKNGYAWWFRKYDRGKLHEGLERGAKEGKLGLWRDLAPIAPWEYREQKKKARLNPK